MQIAELKKKPMPEIIPNEDIEAECQYLAEAREGAQSLLIPRKLSRKKDILTHREWLLLAGAIPAFLALYYNLRK